MFSLDTIWIARQRDALRGVVAGISLAVLVTGVVAPAWAQYSIARFAVAGGGRTRDSGGSYTLGSTIGQATSGQLTGGGYSLGNGFWSGAGGGVTGIEPGDGDEASEIPLAFRLYPTAPNPLVVGPAVVAFDLPQKGFVRVLLYDVGGRLTHTLVDGELPAGRHRLTWNGTDDRGRRTAPGVYFLRLDQGGRVERQKLVIAR